MCSNERRAGLGGPPATPGLRGTHAPAVPAAPAATCRRSDPCTVFALLQKPFRHHDRFYLPGIWLLEQSERAGLPAPSHPAFVGFWPVAMIPATIWLESDVTWYSGSSFGLVGVMMALASYLNAAQNTRLARLMEEPWTQLARLNGGVAGLLARLTAILAARHQAEKGNRTKLPAFLEELRSLQQQLLTHVVDVVQTDLGAAGSGAGLSANWCLKSTTSEPGRGDVFRPALYDRNVIRRVPDPSDPDEWLEIKKGLPGASEAFVTRRVVLTDVHESRKLHPGAIAADVPFAEILSIPVVRGKKQVLGVVNLDAAVRGTLRAEHADLVVDVTYLVGLIEVIRKECRG